MNIAVSNVYQKMGFFPGAHGIPDISRLEDDENSRNIELPYSKVNHLKVTTHQQYLWNGIQLSGDFGYQFNHREEWSAFHTHYDTQMMPAKDPDRELVFKLAYIQLLSEAAVVQLFFLGAYGRVEYADTEKCDWRIFFSATGIQAFYYRSFLADDFPIG